MAVLQPLFEMKIFFETAGANFYPAAAGKTGPLKIGIFSFFRSRIIFPAQKISLAAHSRSFCTNRTLFSHKKKFTIEI